MAMPFLGLSQDYANDGLRILKDNMPNLLHYRYLSAKSVVRDGVETNLVDGSLVIRFHGAVVCFTAVNVP